MSNEKSINTKQVNLDSLDLKIMQLLEDNAKISNTKIAKDIGLTPPSTLERVKKLEDTGLIEGYYARFSREKLKYNITTFVGIALACHNKEHNVQFVQLVKELPQVIECYHTTGKYDFMLKVIARDIKELHEFLLNKLSFSSLIGHVETFLILREDLYGLDVENLCEHLISK